MNRRKLFVAVTLLLAIVFQFVYNTVKAATLTVNTTSLALANDGFCSLPEAVANANDTIDGLVYADCVTASTAGTDTILLSVDIVLNSIMGTSDGVSGLPLINRPLILDGQGHFIERDSSYTSCDGSNPSQEFRILEVNKTQLTLQNITLRNGCANGSNIDGGAIFVDDGSLTLNNSTIENSRAVGVGGAIYGDTNSVLLTVNSSNFINNSAVDGGAIFSRATLNVSNNSSFTSNAAGSDGGAILITNGADLTFDNSTADSNSAVDFGGAITSRNGSYIYIQNNSIISNNSSGSDGGGVYGNSTSAGITILNSTLDGNSSGNDGGGVHSRSPMYINSTQISNNTALGEGGGVRLSDGTSLTIESSLIENNTANLGGGGVHIRDNNSLTIQNGTTIRNNHSLANGGGIYVSSTSLSVFIGNSTIDSNTAVDGAGFYTNISAFVQGSNIQNNVASGSGGGILASNTSSLTVDSSNINSNSATDGGGVYLETSSSFVALNGTSINNNSVLNRGGGIFSLSSPSISLSNISITGNIATAASSDGGGIYQSSGTLYISGGTVSSNSALGDGGGIRLSGAVSSTIVTSTLNQNSANLGGAIFITNDSITIIDSSTLDNNTAVSGAGVYTEAGADMTVQNGSLFSNNAATGDGGGLHAALSATSNIVILDSTFEGNSASNGAGAFARASLGIFHSSFVANTATGNGGAVRQTNNTLTMQNSTLSGNSASQGAGFSNASTATLEFVTIFNNNGGSVHNTGTANILASILFSASGAECAGAIIDNGYNIAGDASCGLGGSSFSNTDPNLAALANNGGLTDTHLPNIGSPAIDTAGVCPSSNNDQRHVSRPFNPNCDIGAVEGGVFVDLILSHSDAPDPILIGNTTSYSLSVQNAGTASATNVVLTVNLPSGASFASASAACSAAGLVVTCNLGTIASTASSSVNITVTCVTAGTLTSNSALALNETDNDISNNTASTSTSCNPLATNTPTATATSIVAAPVTASATVTIAPSSTVTLASATPSSTTTLVPSQTASPTRTQTATATQTATFTATSTATVTATASQTATVTATQTITATFVPSSTQSMTATAEAQANNIRVSGSGYAVLRNRQTDTHCTLLTVGVTCQSNGIYPPLQTETIDTSRPYILKVADSALTWGEGTEISWTIRVVNPTARSLSSVVVTDTLPAELEFVSADVPHTVLSSGAVRFELGRMEGYESQTIQITTRLDGEAGTVINRVCMDYRRLAEQVCNSAQAFNINNLPATGASPLAFWRNLLLIMLPLVLLLAWKGRMLWQRK